jgi:3-isopropylmalate/(R)-2-methylmalate dehydratase small subunit
MKTTLEGNAFTFGKNLDTDQIYPGQYLELAQVEDIKPRFPFPKSIKIL